MKVKTLSVLGPHNASGSGSTLCVLLVSGAEGVGLMKVQITLFRHYIEAPKTIEAQTSFSAAQLILLARPFS